MAMNLPFEDPYRSSSMLTFDLVIDKLVFFYAKMREIICKLMENILSGMLGS
jgi:hypothetical protein